MHVLYNLSVHFVSHGLEFHHQLRPKSLEFLHDDKVVKYVALNLETKHKNRQGGLDGSEAPHDERMYATGDESCTVKTLREFLKRTDPEAESLFNQCVKTALQSPMTSEYWYTAKTMKPYQFSKFMPDIPKTLDAQNGTQLTCSEARRFKLGMTKGSNSDIL